MIEMKYSFWWKQGFYDYEVDGGVGITYEYWQELLEGQSAGKEISEDENGYPILINSGPKTLEEWKDAKVAKLLAYDRSNSVDSFSIGSVSLWLDKNARASMSALISAEALLGKTETTIWYDDESPKSMNISIDNAKTMLATLEVYAKDVFSTTQMHRATINNLTTIDEVKEYDYKVGYPDKLEFVY